MKVTQWILFPKKVTTEELRRKIFYSQFLPKKEEVGNNEVKSLARRLKGKNDAETLTNILEWEDRNLTFWHERWLVYLILSVITLLLMMILLWLWYEQNSFVVIIVSLLVILLLLRGNLLEILIPLTILFCSVLFVIVVVAISVERVPMPSNLLIFSIVASLLVGSSFSMIFLSHDEVWKHKETRARI
ncbi:MAG: transglutaminase-like domain-containing protein [Archaeoglobaceae archaeon]